MRDAASHPGGPKDPDQAAAGCLFLVVGPSGAGKDSLIRGARGRLAGDDRFLFPRRTVTRPADPDSEDFESALPDAFERQRAAGAFCLDWSAHGHCYGVPATAAAACQAGRAVVVNVSRTVIGLARQRFVRVHVVNVTASAGVLAGRLAARGRQSDGDLAVRAARRVDLPELPGVAVTTIVNDGELAAAEATFLDVLFAGR